MATGSAVISHFGSRHESLPVFIQFHGNRVADSFPGGADIYPDVAGSRIAVAVGSGDGRQQGLTKVVARYGNAGLLRYDGDDASTVIRNGITVTQVDGQFLAFLDRNIHDGAAGQVGDTTVDHLHIGLAGGGSAHIIDGGEGDEHRRRP